VRQKTTSVGPHPALIEIAAGRGLPVVTDPVPLVQSALAHGMSGLLLTEVEQKGQPWRRLTRVALTARQARVQAWHDRLWRTLTQIADVFGDLDVEVAIAKGIAAESRWYSRTGERPCNDIDLLLSPAQVARIDDVIAAIEPSHPLCGKTRRLAARGLLQSIDLEYQGVPIDLHWDILKLGIPSRSVDAIWDRTVPFALRDGRSIRALDATSSYVHFLVHLNKDRFRRLLGFVDVARVYASDQVDHADVDRLTRADGIETSVGASWDVVIRTLDLPVRNRIKGQPVKALVWHVAWRPSVRLRAAESTLRFRHRQWLIAALSRGRAVDAARCWIRGLFPPDELLAYVHSGYATRWGGEPVSTTRRSRIWALTAGRLLAALGRRRRLVQVTGRGGSMRPGAGDGTARRPRS
jgi:Uncharacterised nucleotidyltransferase